jgi:disulfide bond formation protein DsbB
MRKRLTILLIAGALVLTACGGSDSSDDGGSDGSETTAPAAGTAGDAANGLVLYDTSCSACHGPGGIGVDGLGKPWVNSTFIAGKTDEGMIAFIKVGRDVDDPENTTGIIMPPKGGNPALSDQDLVDIVAYMRTIN